MSNKKSKKSNFKKPESAEQKAKRQFQNLAKMASGNLNATDNNSAQDNSQNSENFPLSDPKNHSQDNMNSQKSETNSEEIINSKSESKNSNSKENKNNFQMEARVAKINEEKNEEKASDIIQNNSELSKNSAKAAKNLTNPDLYPKVMISLLLVASMAFSLFVNGYFLPEVVLQNTDSAVAERAKKEADEKIAQSKAKKAESLALENAKLKFTDQKIAMNIKDFGTLKIDLNDKAAPKTVENFVRLASRKYFDGTVFHRMVESPTFNVIQGGDPTATGTGGETASGEPLVDEVWKVKPQSDPQNPGQFLNTPEFRDPSIYKDFNIKTGEVTYAKGQILMAKTSAPDSASSQFFITLTDTKLPAEYTIFGTLQAESFQILDKIAKEVDPISKAPEGTPETYKDGTPNKELKIETLTIL